jgi:thiosulfate/3-mercaptopyruvate sulfurtransferase
MEASTFLDRIKPFLLLAAALLLYPAGAMSDDLSAIVSTDWLAQHLTNSRVVILDIRSAAQYSKAHIPGSFSTPFNLWAIGANGLTMELPSDDALRGLLGRSGIDPDTFVVIVNRTETDFSRADATRAAWTCMLAGVRNVGVLDGGYNKWVNENKTVTTEVPQAVSKSYSGTIDRSTKVSKDYVMEKIGESILVDGRLPQDYFGIASNPGHIRSAVNMPAPWAFAHNGTFLSEQELHAMAAGVVGTDKSREIIVYCEVGGYASTWWFLLTQVLGYSNVKLYDGSVEEWFKDPKAPVSRYSWH